MTIAASLHEDTNFRGRVFNIDQDVSVPVIPPPLKANHKSLIVYSSTWITFWWGKDYSQRGSSLWFPPTPENSKWQIFDLAVVRRATSGFFDNNWKDDIASVSFSGDPGEDHSRKTIFRLDGSYTVGNESAILSANDIKERVEAYRRLLEAKGVAALVPR